MRRSVIGTLVWSLLAIGLAAQTNQYDAGLAKVRSSDGFKRAIAVLDRDFDRFVA